MTRTTLSLITALLLAAPSLGQGPPVKFQNVRVGFQPYSLDDSSPFKVGLWTPLYVQLQAGPEALKPSTLRIETADSEDVGTFSDVDIPKLDKNEKHTVIAYAKPGNVSGNFKIRVLVEKREDAAVTYPAFSAPSLQLGERLLLTVGGRIADLQEALRSLAPRMPGEADRGDARSTWPRFAAYEDAVEMLPLHDFVYESVDLLILTTDNAGFVTSLQRDAERLRALAAWVRHGGRMITSVSARNQELVHELLKAPAWYPPLPVSIPKVRRPGKDDLVEHVPRVETWAGVQDKPFRVPRGKLADLGAAEQNRSYEVLAEGAEGRTLVVRVPYGRGSVTLLAFDLEKEPFANWIGRKAFLAGMIRNLEPPSPIVNRNELRGQDLTTQLQRMLDTFDVPVISFGWVALFILIYILIVGPLDYFLLKKVFKRLEWTWITFPTVVLLVSGIAYFTAYAIKGKELKINKIDLVDFDLRTDLDGNQRTRAAFAYGETWFTLLSPRIHSYTIGVEPQMAAWGLAEAPKRPLGAQPVSWLGRPEFDGPGSFGRARTGFLRRPYEFSDNAAGLRRVPIPVWTSKAFTASWEMALSRPPFDADLVYQAGNRQIQVAGTLKSNLPFDLVDVWIMYRNRCYEIGRLSGRNSPAMEVSLNVERGQSLQNWIHQMGVPIERFPGRDGRSIEYDPTRLLKEVLFQEKVDVGANNRNHALRGLDLSWRLREDEASQSGTREIILYGRMPRRIGGAEDVTSSQDEPPPAALWLGAIPGIDREDRRPGLEGTMIQDTYVRAIIPVRPKN